MIIEEQFSKITGNMRSVHVGIGYIFLGFNYNSECYYKMRGVAPYVGGRGKLESFDFLHLIRRGK